MKKRILSTFLTLALLLTLLPTAVMAEGNRTIYTDMSYKGAETGSDDQPYASFETALEKAQDGDTIAIKGKSFINVQTVEDAPFVINKAVTITGADNSTGELYIRASGILLGADVTMQNVELNLANKYHNAIFVNGHRFTAENITRGSGSRAVHLFAGGLAGTSAASGSNAVLTLINSTFGNIHGGGMNGSYTGSAEIHIEKSTVGAIYGSGAKEATFNRDNWFDTTEPPVPEVKADQYPVNGTVKIAVDGASTAGGTYTVSVDGNGSSNTSLTINDAIASKKLNLAGLSSLTVNGGTAAIAEINETADVKISGATFNLATAVKTAADGKTTTIASLSGNGKIILDKEDVLNIMGAFEGTYTFETSGGFNEASGLAKYDHTYIMAVTNSATVSFNPHATQTDMNLEWKEGDGWKTSALPEIPAFVKGFQITKQSKTLTTAEIGQENSYIPVTWESPSDSDKATLTQIPFRYEVTCGGHTYSGTANEKNNFDAWINLESDFICFSASDGDPYNNTSEGILISGSLSCGVYQISVFAPDANGGEIQQSFTLIVTEESPSTTETTTTIEKSGLQNVTFGEDLTLTATVTANDTPVDNSAVEYYINGKKIDSNSVSVTPDSGFKLGSNELRAIYPGSDTHAVSVGTANVTVSKAADASIHGFQVPSGGTFNGTTHTGSQTNLTVQRNGVTLDSSPSVTVEYTLNGQAVSQPVSPEPTP